MKKSVLFQIMIAFIIMSVIIISSCHKDGDPNNKDIPVQPQTANIIKDQVLPDNLLGYFDANVVTVTGSLESPIQSSSPDLLGGPTATTPGANALGVMFRDLLVKLKVTNAVNPVQRAIMAYQKCVNDILSLTIDKRREILVSAELQRKAILDRLAAALKNVPDAVTAANLKKAAAAEIKKLNDDTAAKLDALIDKAGLCDCWNTLVKTIRVSLPSTEQIAIFDKWLAVQITPCPKASVR